MADDVLLVKCKDCRHLAVRDPQMGEAVEATEQLRQKGLFRSLTGLWKSPRLICRKNVIPLHESQFETAAEVTHKINEKINCDCFEVWLPGHNPQEISKMSIHHQMHEWQERMEETSERRHKETIRLSVTFGVVSAVLATVAVIISLCR